jgi:hypothetical protein
MAKLKEILSWRRHSRENALHLPLSCTHSRGASLRVHRCAARLQFSSLRENRMTARLVVTVRRLPLHRARRASRPRPERANGVAAAFQDRLTSLLESKLKISCMPGRLEA